MYPLHFLREKQHSSETQIDKFKKVNNKIETDNSEDKTNLPDIHKLVELLYNLLQNLLSSRNNYGEKSFILVQTNSKWLNIVTPSSKNSSNSIDYATFIPNKYWNGVTFHPGNI